MQSLTARLFGLCGVLLATVVPVLAFYPGVMNADSLTLYSGAVIPAPVMDWHSPFLTFCLRLLIRAGGGVPAFTALQCAIYVGSFYWLLSGLRLSVPARLAILAVVLVAPPTMPWIATVEKTSFMSALLGAAFVGSLRLDRGPDLGTTRAAALLGSILLLAVLGTWCRPNAVIIFLPIALFVAWQARRAGCSMLVAAGCLGGFVLLALGAAAIAVRLGAVVRTYPQQATMDLDLVNLSIATGRDLLPPGILAAPFADVKAAMAIDPFVLWRIDTSLRRITDAAAMQHLQAAWLAAIRHYPLAYAHYRFALYRQYLCFDLSTICYGSWHWYTGGIDANPFGLVSRKLPGVFGFYKAVSGSIAFHPFFHLFGVLAALIGALVVRQRVVACYAAVLLLFDLSNALLIPGVTARMAVPLGLMLPFLLAGLYADPARRRPARACVPAPL